MSYTSLDTNYLVGIRDELTASLAKIESLLLLVEEREHNPFEGMQPQERIKYIIEGMSRFFGVPEEDVFPVKNRRKKINLRRKMGAMLLTKYANISQEPASLVLGYSNRSSVANSISRMEEWLLPPPFGDKEVKQQWKDLVAYLKLKDFSTR